MIYIKKQYEMDADLGAGGTTPVIDHIPKDIRDDMNEMARRYKACFGTDPISEDWCQWMYCIMLLRDSTSIKAITKDRDLYRQEANIYMAQVATLERTLGEKNIQLAWHKKAIAYARVRCFIAGAIIALGVAIVLFVLLFNDGPIFPDFNPEQQLNDTLQINQGKIPDSIDLRMYERIQKVPACSLDYKYIIYDAGEQEVDSI